MESFKYGEFTKFDFYNTAFERLFSQIIRIWKLLFRSVETYFSGKLLCLQRETVLPPSSNNFFYLSVHPWYKKLVSP